ncbi:hypothetical protein QJQ45_017477 [Haematococcus lacustris]|nr:hypothetical protein QJQ45_017477 [Haematococcus lacustris]
MSMLEGITSEAARSVPRGSKRSSASKYDMIKVNVWLGEQLEHHYILSRFLICRILTVTRIPHAKATKIALELKKQLVDKDMLDITQDELESALFNVMAQRGFGPQHVECYRMVSSFMAARQPLIVLLCGAPWTGKSSIAQQLASRLNMPNIMRTSLIHDMMAAGGLAPDLHPLPLCARQAPALPLTPHPSALVGGTRTEPVSTAADSLPDHQADLLAPEALLAAYQTECVRVRLALEGDWTKALKDGKPLIVEGSHLDLGALLPQLEAQGLVLAPSTKSVPPPCLSTGPEAGPSTQLPCMGPDPQQLLQGLAGRAEGEQAASQGSSLPCLQPSLAEGTEGEGMQPEQGAGAGAGAEEEGERMQSEQGEEGGEGRPAMRLLWWRPVERMELVAVGAHMSGLPLNHQLLSLGGRLVKCCKTSAAYTMHSLGPRPAMVRVAPGMEHAGRQFEVEVWSLPLHNVGRFLRDGVKPPLCIGDVLLEDGSQVKGFLGEGYAVANSSVEDISQWGGWRAYLASKAAVNAAAAPAQKPAGSSNTSE